jgi:biotin-[acetyl-CoA-carboxylase] ligase BirA-like protein
MPSVSPPSASSMLDAQRLTRALAASPAELGLLPEVASLRPDFQLHLYEQLPSTNETAWQLIDQGGGAGTVVIAAAQTAGRGQWGRTWVSPPGGLYLSLVLEPELPLPESSLLTLTSAWGIATSLGNLGLPLQIKWPNDLVSQGRKIGGILTESRLAHSPTPGHAPQLQQVVIGVGLNWDNPLPPERHLSPRVDISVTNADLKHAGRGGRDRSSGHLARDVLLAAARQRRFRKCVYTKTGPSRKNRYSRWAHCPSRWRLPTG